MTTIEERFWAKVQPTGFCWEWIASKDGTGYGKFWNGERLVPAHRLAYELLIGPIPDGAYLDHLCRNHGCVNPDHIEPVTPRENVLRGFSPMAHEARQTHCIHGHALTGGNLYIWSGQPNQRKCKTCRSSRVSARKAKK